MVVLERIWNYLLMERRSRRGPVDAKKPVIGLMGNPGDYGCMGVNLNHVYGCIR